MTKIINATPHNITVLRGDESVVFEKTDILARVSSSTEVTGNINGFQISHQTFGEIEGLPEEQIGVFYIVSAMVLSANKTRNDLLAPDSGATAIRNDKGHIIAVKGFVR